MQHVARGCNPTKRGVSMTHSKKRLNQNDGVGEDNRKKSIVKPNDEKTSIVKRNDGEGYELKKTSIVKRNDGEG